jgi:hypothetical protein
MRADSETTTAELRQALETAADANRIEVLSRVRAEQAAAAESEQRAQSEDGEL